MQRTRRQVTNESKNFQACEEVEISFPVYGGRCVGTEERCVYSYSKLKEDGSLIVLSRVVDTDRFADTSWEIEFKQVKFENVLDLEFVLGLGHHVLSEQEWNLRVLEFHHDAVDRLLEDNQ